MTLKEIKAEAIRLQPLDYDQLDAKIEELKKENVGFLGCVAFLQYHLSITLSEAKDLLLSMKAWEDKKEQTETMINLMLSDFDE